MIGVVILRENAAGRTHIVGEMDVAEFAVAGDVSSYVVTASIDGHLLDGLVLEFRRERGQQALTAAALAALGFGRKRKPVPII